jgi:hypothetical protein
MEHKIGLRVLVACRDSECDGWVGTVVGGLQLAFDPTDGWFHGQEVHFDDPAYVARCRLEQDMPTFEPRELIPIEDQYDGNRLGEWELCPWKPAQPVSISEQRSVTK